MTTTGKLPLAYDARERGGVRARISHVLLRGVATTLVGLSLAGWVAQPLESYAQESDPGYAVEYTGTADFSSPGVYGGDSSSDFAVGSIDLHVEWTAVGTGAFADALLLDDAPDFNAAPGTYQGNGTFLRFSNLSGTLSKRVPDGQVSGMVPAIFTSSRDNCTSTLSQVPGAQLPYGSALSPSIDLQSEAFYLVTVLPLDAAYVQSDNAASQCSISIPRGQLFGLPLYRPSIVADSSDFKRAVRPFYLNQLPAGARSFDDSVDFDFDMQTGYVAGKLGDGSFRTPPVGTWKGHIQSRIHVVTIQPGDTIFGT